MSQVAAEAQLSGEAREPHTLWLSAARGAQEIADGTESQIWQGAEGDTVHVNSKHKNQKQKVACLT